MPCWRKWEFRFANYGNHPVPLARQLAANLHAWAKPAIGFTQVIAKDAAIDADELHAGLLDFLDATLMHCAGLKRDPAFSARNRKRAKAIETAARRLANLLAEERRQEVMPIFDIYVMALTRPIVGALVQQTPMSHDDVANAHSPLSEVIRDLQRKADEYAQAPISFVPSPKKNSAPLTYFCRQLADFFSHTTGQERRQDVRTVASVAFGRDVSDAEVQNAVGRRTRKGMVRPS